MQSVVEQQRKSRLEDPSQECVEDSPFHLQEHRYCTDRLEERVTPLRAGRVRSGPRGQSLPVFRALAPTCGWWPLFIPCPQPVLGDHFQAELRKLAEGLQCFYWAQEGRGQERGTRVWDLPPSPLENSQKFPPGISQIRVPRSQPLDSDGCGFAWSC